MEWDDPAKYWVLVSASVIAHGILHERMME